MVKQGKVLSLILGFIFSYHSFSSDKNSKQTKKNLALVLSKKFYFHYPKIAMSLARSLLEFPKQPRPKKECFYVSVEAVGSGSLIIPFLKTSPTQTIRVLKQKIAQMLKIPPQKIVRLFLEHGGEELRTGSLEKNKIIKGSTLALFKRNLSKQEILALNLLLLKAAQFGDHEKLKKALDRGAEVNFKGINQLTALHMASIQGSAKCVELLLQYGADIDARDEKKKTALIYASRGPSEAVEVLLIRKANGNAQDNWLNTALHNAVTRKKIQSVRALLEAGIRINARNFWGRTALHKAARSGNQEILKLLLEYGADSDVLDSDGRTAQETAEREGHLAIVEILKKN